MHACKTMLSAEAYDRRVKLLRIIGWLVMLGLAAYAYLFWEASFEIGRIRDGRYHPEWFYLFGFYQLLAWNDSTSGLIVLIALTLLSYAGMHILRRTIKLGYVSFRNWVPGANLECTHCGYDLTGTSDVSNRCPECGRCANLGAHRSNAYRAAVAGDYRGGLGSTFIWTSIFSALYVVSVLLSRYAGNFVVAREFEIIRQVLVPTYWMPVVMGFGYLDMAAWVGFGKPLKRKKLRARK